ncbi:MCP four helix bundle domain-containing protein, partial [Oscillospiraceae bacterium PP1C4]
MKKWFYNLKISSRIMLGITIMIIIATIIGIMGIFSMQNINATYTLMYHNEMVSLESIEKAAVNFQRGRKTLDSLVLNSLNDDKEKVEYFLQRVTYYNTVVNENCEKYRQTDLTSDEQVVLDNLDISFKVYRELENRVKELATKKQADEAQTLIENNMREVALNIDTAFDKLYALNIEMGNECVKQNTATTNIFTISLSIFILIGVGAALRIGFLISRSISNPVNKMMVAADKLAVGDINVDVQSDSTDEIGLLMHSFEK